MATISNHHVRMALGGLIRHGYEPEHVLIKAGINPLLINAVHSRVSDQQMTTLIQLIWKILADEFMGFTATVCKPGAFSLMAHSVYRCANLREALQQGTQFFNFITDDIHTQLTEVENQAIITITFSQPELDAENFFLDFWLIIWHRFSSWLIGKKIPLIKTTLSYPQPTYAMELHHLFPGSHQFCSKKNQLVFHIENLNLPLIRSINELDQFLIQSPADLMTIPGEDKSLRNTITRLIMSQNNLPNNSALLFPTISQIANHLHLTPITLHRKLKSEGINYQQIKENIRRDIALNKLTKERLKIKEIAEIVGFSESSSFTRAFKGWTGLTPREYCKFIKP